MDDAPIADRPRHPPGARPSPMRFVRNARYHKPIDAFGAIGRHVTDKPARNDTNSYFRSPIGEASVRVTARRSRKFYRNDGRFGRNGNRCGIFLMQSSTGLAGN